MELIKASGLNYNNGSKDILNNANFRILEGEKYGLIGPNGVGKTTLIRILLGQTEKDSGGLNIRENLNIGYVPQNQETGPETTIGDFLLGPQKDARRQIADCEKLMASAGEDEMGRILARYQHLLEELDKKGGYSALETGENLLRRLGLENSLDQSLETLSGGERGMVFFARALLGNPDLLVLDEPGNHLDYLGLAWLEAFLASYPKAVLIVSHNRYLLDKTCGKLLAMNDATLFEFTGTYSNYRTCVLHKAVLARSEYEAGLRRITELEKRIKQLQSIAGSQYNPPAQVMRHLGSAKRKYAAEKEKLLDKPDIPTAIIELDIQGEGSKSAVALRIANYSLAFGNNVLLDKASMEVFCGERVALVGPNGSGKSSLLKAALEDCSWDGKDIKIGPSQKIGYLSQVPEFSSHAVTVEDEVRSWGPLTKEAAFALVNKMGFCYDDMDKRISVLSGGETNRLQLARFLYNQTNFLVLDEPTNHMDIQSREAIEEAVSAFEGTILVVSHDRFFLDNLVNRVVEINDKKLVSYQGNFSDYFKLRYPVLPRLSGDINRRGGERKRDQAKVSNAALDIEKRIHKAEKEKLELEKELEKCFRANDHIRGRKLAVELEKLGPLIEKYYSEWDRALD